MPRDVGRNIFAIHIGKGSAGIKMDENTSQKRKEQL